MDHVVGERIVVGVHQKDADRVRQEDVLAQLVAMRVHQVEAVSALANPVSPDDVVLRVPDDRVARLHDVVVLDPVAVRIPDADRVAAQRLGQLPGGDAVAADDVHVGLLQLEAEQAVLDDIVAVKAALAAQANRRIRGLVTLAGIAERQADHLRIVRLDGEDRTDAAAIDDGALFAFDPHRASDHAGRAVHAGGKTQHAAGRRRIDQWLQERGARRETPQAFQFFLGTRVRRRRMMVGETRLARQVVDAEGRRDPAEGKDHEAEDRRARAETARPFRPAQDRRGDAHRLRPSATAEQPATGGQPAPSPRRRRT